MGGRWGWHGHPGPRAEQMSVTTCFLTPVRVLVTPRMRPAEKFMTPEVSCPPSKTAASPSPSPPSAFTSLLLFSTPCRRSLCHLHLTSRWTTQTPLTLIKSNVSVEPNTAHGCLLKARQRQERATPVVTELANALLEQAQSKALTLKNGNKYHHPKNSRMKYNHGSLMLNK